MLPPSHPLIEAATKPLADNAEQHLAANALLGETFDPDHPGVAGVMNQLEAADRRKLPFLRKVVLWILAALALGMAVSFNMPTFRFMEMVYNFELFAPLEKPQLPAGLSDQERLLLGDPELGGIDQEQRLHQSAPDNPAYFAEYFQSVISGPGEIAPELLKTADRIAPDNAFFTYVAAGQVGKKSFTKKSIGGPRRKPRFVGGVRLSPLPREMEFDITDEAAFEEALTLVAEAASQSGFETYTNVMIAERVRLLPSITMAEFARTLMYAYGTTSSGIIHLRHVADLLSARAEQLSKSGREEEFLKLAADRDALISHLGRNPDTYLIGELVHLVIASATATNFYFAADRLGLSETAEIYRKQNDAFREYRDTRDIRDHNGKNSFPEDRALSLTGFSLPMVSKQVNSPPPISESDLKPMRMAEHELLGGLGVLAAAVLILPVALAVFLFRFVATPVIRVPAKRFAATLGVLDWFWVIGLGVATPILCFLLVNRFSPLGGRDYGSAHFVFAFPLVHLVALLLALLIAPALVIRWRLGKGLAPFGLTDRFTVIVFLAALSMIVAVALAALPVLVGFGMKNSVLIALAVTPVLCLFLLFANALRAVCGKSKTRLMQCATAVAVLPAYPVAIIALCLLIPIYSAGEKHWLAQETLMRIDPSAPDLGAYEFKIAAQKRKESNAILER